MSKHFNFNGKMYGTGTVVLINENYRKDFGFYSRLVFDRYDEEKGLYFFTSLSRHWDMFGMNDFQIEECIETIVKPYGVIVQIDPTPVVDPDNIEGIVSAWIWYIIIMCLGFFLKDIIDQIIVWALASIIFFSWRHKKMNGG